MITRIQFESVFGKTTDTIFNSIIAELLTADITTKERISAFLSQCGHESALFKVRSENLNYSGEALLKVFPKYFNTGNVSLYQRQPEKIANKVYGNRMGNGPEASGEGYKYRGRGYIQITGKDNYNSFYKLTGIDVINNPDYFITDEGAIKSATWFWNSRLLNNLADSKDFVKITKIINGGTNGYDHRLSLYNKLLEILI